MNHCPYGLGCYRWQINCPSTAQPCSGCMLTHRNTELGPNLLGDLSPSLVGSLNLHNIIWGSSPTPQNLDVENRIFNDFSRGVCGTCLRCCVFQFASPAQAPWGLLEGRSPHFRALTGMQLCVLKYEAHCSGGMLFTELKTQALAPSADSCRPLSSGL